MVNTVETATFIKQFTHISVNQSVQSFQKPCCDLLSASPEREATRSSKHLDITSLPCALLSLQCQSSAWR